MAKITRDQERKFHDATSTELRKLGLTKEKLQEFIEGPRYAVFVEAQRKLIQSIPELVSSSVSSGGQTEFNLTVNYDQSIEDARKRGNYDWENSDITSKNFPTNRKGTADVTIKLVHFDRSISSENAIKELDKIGLRPAETHELLALGASYPELQREFPIIALGSVWRDRYVCRSVPYLRRCGSERRLDRDWFGNDWLEHCRFAAVPK